ncbi:TetR/AcrR family transcriptional regulator [Nocardioides sambongensis]|uniref:TetR/AcrR family transcriptional regulator n=1 Tax=Nocardioides sambongensis TaxID=2589074 RepID=UPI0015E82EC5|nr:TetR/AcrR family transcriptional regulator [Nocardioides sambongensis]
MAYVKAADRSRQIVEAARQVLMREGVNGTTLRLVAREAGIPQGTLHYVFPSKEELLHAVIEDVATEIADVLHAAAETDRGLEHAIREGLTTFWQRLVAQDVRLQIMQYELVIWALRTPGREQSARWQFERYCRIVAAWCQEAAQQADETCAVPFEVLARMVVAAVDGVILQYVGDPDPERAERDLAVVVDMLVGLAQPSTAVAQSA